MKKSPICLNIEKKFAVLKTTPLSSTSTYATVLAEISRDLRLLYPQNNFTIKVINNRTGKFRGMTIYPTIEDAERLVTAIMDTKSNSSMNRMIEIWSGIKSWVIEIDSGLFTNTTLNASPAEITAILLHEIGHVKHYHRVPHRVKRVYTTALSVATIRIRKILSWSPIKPMMVLLVYEACTNLLTSNLGNREESAADATAVAYGYGEDLQGFIEKLIIYGNDVDNLIGKTEDDIDKDLEIMMEWIIVNTASLEYRRRDLEKSIRLFRLRTPSIMFSRALDNIRETYFPNVNNRTKEVILESTLADSYRTVVREPLTIKADLIEAGRDITPADITILEDLVDKIDNRSDAIFALSVVNKTMDQLHVTASIKKDNLNHDVPVSDVVCMSQVITDLYQVDSTLDDIYASSSHTHDKLGYLKELRRLRDKILSMSVSDDIEDYRNID